ncbi:hypothetical protein P3F83_01095 [Mycobacteroides immunogenum]|uniref:hypothetical protein n=1 Tax=Mycobacteroides immunogenum TaxID=83262 RepID=UPI0025B78C84|nr:hypothetical protein [Mycobacteroides immunogenum]WJR34081.1 hypothetical protein P3F83_01095 [Mycobacteroides immunogenum]
MNIRTFGAAVGVTAVLAAVPLTMLGTESDTGAGIPVAQAAPTTLYPGDPGYDDARQWERDLPSYTPPATHTVTVTPTTTTKPASPATNKKDSGGFPWWFWVLGTIVVLGGLLWWGTTLDDGSSARAALRAARDDDDDDDDDDAGSSYPDIPTPRNAREQAVLDAWIEREDARERAGQPSRRWPTQEELVEMTRLGVEDYEQLPGNGLSYPAIPTSPVPELTPYPEQPSAPVAPAPSASLMDRLGK